ncbi:hypothetical protein P885DRAFT_71243 [Corynascus similis CBS 632.67]
MIGLQKRGSTTQTHPTLPKPTSRTDFEIAVICALPIEADAVEALFDRHWDDDGFSYNKAENNTNAYSTGTIGCHNVVLAHMSGMGKASAAMVATNCRRSFPNIKLTVVVGVCGVVPFRFGGNGETIEIVLGDVIVSDGVVQYDFGRRLPEQFVTKDTLLDSLGRPNTEIRALLAKLKGLRSRKMLQGKMVGYMDVLRGEPELAAVYPGVEQDRLFEATYGHVRDGMSCENCACGGKLIPRARLAQGDRQPAVHFGLIASGDTVMKSGKDRDDIARETGVIGFEMESAGVWDTFPCVVIKGACDYADSHKTKTWQRYAAATAAACMKAFLNHWMPSVPVLVPYPRNDSFVGRADVLESLKQLLVKSASQARAALYGLGGIGKTQIALEYAYRLKRECSEMSVFWVHASNAERFRQAYTSIAQECRVPGYDDPKTDILTLVKKWLERKDCRRWLMVIDNADDTQLFFGQQGGYETGNHTGNLAQYLPECLHGAILATTRNKQAGWKLTKGKTLIEIGIMNEGETDQLLSTHLDGISVAPGESFTLSSRLERLPLALVQAAAFIQENSIDVGKYLEHLDGSNQNLIDLLSEDFETEGRDSKTPRALAETWILSFEQIQRQNAFAGELLSLMSLLDRQAIPLDFLSHYSKKQQNQETRGELQLTKALGVLKAFSFWKDAERLQLEAVKLREEVLGSDHTLTLTSMANLASTYRTQGRWKEAEKLQVQVVESCKTKFGADHPWTLTSINNLALTYNAQGRWEEAEKLQVQVIGTHKTKLGADHPYTLALMANIASTYSGQGRWDEAEKLQVQVVESRKTKFGADHPKTLASINNLALTYQTQGRWKEAEKLQVQVIGTHKTKLGADHPYTLAIMANIASTYSGQGRWEEAEKLQVQVMETRKTKLGSDHPDTLASKVSPALMYLY